MNNIIIHKIVKYLKNPRIAKLFFYFPDYRKLINSSNSHYDELYDLYGNKLWYKNTSNLRSVQSMLRLKIPFRNGPTDPMNFAARDGHLEIIKWLHNNSLGGCDENAMNWAAENGHLEVIKWLHQNRKEGCKNYAMNYAAKNGHLEVIKWLHENRQEGCSYNAMDWAAKYGHLEVVKWLHENLREGLMTSGSMCTTAAMNCAALNGHLEIVKWLHENRQEGYTQEAMNYAASNGHLEIVKWLYENRKGDIALARTYAIWYDRLEVKKWIDSIKYFNILNI